VGAQQAWIMTEERDLGASQCAGRLQQSNGAGSEVAGTQGSSAAPNYRQDGQNAGNSCAAGRGATVRHKRMAGGCGDDME